ncbi:hypothetical protein FALCPG4_005357 [Fusarium falciforme]
MTDSTSNANDKQNIAWLGLSISERPESGRPRAECGTTLDMGVIVEYLLRQWQKA